jgi:predicted nucleotidyltransferase
MTPVYPTPQHTDAASVLVKHYQEQPGIDAVLLVNSCARGKATPDSCLDIAVLVPEETDAVELEAYEHHWEDFYRSHPVFTALRNAGRYSVVHIDFWNGNFTRQKWDDGGGPDSFELEIGNRMVYSVPLHESGVHMQKLRDSWLPYYDEDLRRQRLRMVQDACRYDLEHVLPYIQRQLYFQAFDRLYKGFQEFLQALFIARRTYPIAYNKWIHEQVVGILGLHELYPNLLRLFEIQDFESSELSHKADKLLDLLETYT